MIEFGIFLLGVVAGCAICVSYKAIAIAWLEHELTDLKMINLHHALWALQRDAEIEAWESLYGKFPGSPVGEGWPPKEKTEEDSKVT